MLGTDSFAHVVTQISGGTKTQRASEVKVGQPIAAFLKQRSFCVRQSFLRIIVLAAAAASWASATCFKCDGSDHDTSDNGSDEVSEDGQAQHHDHER